MNFRRDVIRILLSVFALMLATTGVSAQSDYPSKPIKIIVPYVPGGGTDLFARILAQQLGNVLGQPVFVDNRGGASGMVGGAAVAQAAPDGYTLLVDQSSIATNPMLYAKVPFDVAKDLTPVALGTTFENVLFASPAFPATNLREVIALAKSKPNELNYGSTGAGSLQHLTMEVLAEQAGIQLVHVPYKGASPALLATSMNEVQLSFMAAASALPLVQSGKLKVIGTGDLKRSKLLLNAPTIAESGLPGYQSISWIAVFAPAGTPKPIVNKLNEAINKVLQMPNVIEQLRMKDFDPAGGSPEELAATVQRDAEKYGRIIKKLGIKLD